MIVDSNAPSPLKYTDPTFQPSLFVRAKIYDTSGVSPTLEGTVNLAQIDNGTYWGKYTFTAGKTYLVQKLVYTSGSYAAVDQSYAQDNDDVQCIDLKIANLDSAISSRVSTAHFDTIIGSPTNASISADLAEIESETDGIAAIPTNPLLTTDVRLNHLDADISSRVLTTHFDTVIGTPVNASISADIAEVESDIDTVISQTTATVIAADVWDALVASHSTVGTFGFELQNQVLTPAQVAAAVWNALTATYNAPGTFGASTQSGSLTPSEVTAAVLDVLIADHLSPGSVGEAISGSSAQCATGPNIELLVQEATNIAALVESPEVIVQIVEFIVQFNI
jgi:hypothetical protein